MINFTKHVFDVKKIAFSDWKKTVPSKSCKFEEIDKDLWEKHLHKTAEVAKIDSTIYVLHIASMYDYFWN